MSSKLPLFLHEAVVTLYPASADGGAVTGFAIWSGALVNNFRCGLTYDEATVMGSGDPYGTTHHVDEETVISLGRTWILPKSNSITDFKPVRNQQYVLQVVWNSDGYWYSLTFYGVTGRSVGLESQGTNQFLTNQVFRAKYSLDAGGPNVTVPVFIPVTAPAGESEPFGFFREDPFVNGEYLLGVYNFATAVKLGVVEFIGLAPLTPVTLTLEINGILTGNTLVIPGGTPNVEVSASINLGGIGVSAGNNVRWKITAGPAPQDSAWQSALIMQVQNS